MDSISNNRFTPSSDTVLVITDGSDQAQRLAEWKLVFGEFRQTTVHQIDVLDCVDSGVIIRTHKNTKQDRRERQNPPSASTGTDPANRYRGATSGIDVLHGIPHEAVLDYVTAHEIDRIIVSRRGAAECTRSRFGQLCATVSRVGGVPMSIIGVSDELARMDPSNGLQAIFETIRDP